MQTVTADRHHTRNGHSHSAAHDMRQWTCRKRDGSAVPFDTSKIRLAVARCFASVGIMGDDAYVHGETVTRGVLNSLRGQASLDTNTEFDVETVQRHVIQQLWANGLFVAAEHYQNYREEHRRARLDHPISLEHAARVAEDQAHFPSDLQYYQFISKFSRWRESDKRRETWRESCDRVMGWFKGLPKVDLRQDEWDMLDASLYGLETSCAMRVVQMAGPALERCHVGVFNCAYCPLDSFRAFGEFLYVLMSGSGCGFSVEDVYVSKLPRIHYQVAGYAPCEYVVQDDTESWCDSTVALMTALAAGYDLNIKYHLIRKKNTRLKIKGGRASGPDPLIELHGFIRAKFLERQGGVLTDLDCHDLACKTGSIVQVGGVRRAATISISELNSRLMREAKSGNWYDANSHRTMANNSAAYSCKPPVEVFMEEFLALVKSKSGERGIFNREAVQNSIPARRQKIWYFGMNPCGEIVLRPKQFCNLSIVVARPWDTRETLIQKVLLATYWGCMQKTATNFRYLDDEWRANCEEEALLGVDITGHADCPLLQYGAPGRAELLRELRDVVRAKDVELSARFGVNESAANTCVKPGGDSGVFFNCASGVSDWYAETQIRWVREQACGPVAQFLAASGVPHAEAPESKDLMVFGFPRRAPEGSTTRDSKTAIQQLENWLEWKTNWAEHSVACTVYVDAHEWPGVMAWVYEHFDQMTGVSFNPKMKGNSGYKYLPNEEVARDEYDAALAAFPRIDWSKLTRFETDDQTVVAQTIACYGGSCD